MDSRLNYEMATERARELRAAAESRRALGDRRWPDDGRPARARPSERPRSLHPYAVMSWIAGNGNRA